MTQFLGKLVKGQGHTGTLCIQLKCAITQYWVIVPSSCMGGNICGHAKIFWYKLLAISTSQLSSNGSKNYGLYDQFDHNSYCQRRDRPTLLKPRKTVYPMLYQQKLNVINYKHETNALAYTFKAGSWHI